MVQKSISDVINDTEIGRKLFLKKSVVKSDYELSSVRDIKERDKEVEIYYEYLKDVFIKESPSNIFMYGKPGLGKTILTKWVLKEVEIAAKDRDIKLCIIIINCEIHCTEHSIWQQINKELPIADGNEKKIIGNSTPKQAAYFQELINDYPGIIIIVLDELDKSVNPVMINKIIRSRSIASKFSPCLITVTNNAELKDKFPPHLKSILCENDLILEPYNAEQLIAILECRAKVAFKERALHEVVIPLCAALSAQEHGDARKAMDLLRVAGELAENRKSDIVEEIDVRNAKEKIEIDRVIEVIKTLPTQSKTVLLACIYIIDRNSECFMSYIYEVYAKICTKIEMESLTQRRVSDLISEMDQLGTIKSTIVYRGRYGRQKTVEKITSRDSALEIIYTDEKLKPLKEDSPHKFFSIFGNS